MRTLRCLLLSKWKNGTKTCFGVKLLMEGAFAQKRANCACTKCQKHATMQCTPTHNVFAKCAIIQSRNSKTSTRWRPTNPSDTQKCFPFLWILIKGNILLLAFYIVRQVVSIRIALSRAPWWSTYIKQAQTRELIKQGAFFKNLWWIICEKCLLLG